MDKSYVWKCTPESIEKKQVSIIACVEIAWSIDPKRPIRKLFKNLHHKLYRQSNSQSGIDLEGFTSYKWTF